ncbi:unnamed protein product [Periconia digitata]|uniref:Uncharacterized protein n=1 Tax=Periconia digitata TaxID=1303443 RepID=A0A9W4U8K2_9PLEO|nr:unnamed protein product [Periconia digitata]
MNINNRLRALITERETSASPQARHPSPFQIFSYYIAESSPENALLNSYDHHVCCSLRRESFANRRISWTYSNRRYKRAYRTQFTQPLELSILRK